MTEDEFMLTAILDCERVDFYSGSKTLSESEQAKFSAMKARRAQGEPLQYILGHAHFMGLRLSVDPRVFIPRPETELLAEAAIESVKPAASTGNLRILDLGTGSGNLTTAIASFLPDAHFTAVDISSEALDAARENAQWHGVSSRVNFIHQDMFDFLAARNFSLEKFHLIVCNPPYIPSALISSLPVDVRQEPVLALDGGKDGLDFYRRLAGPLRNVLVPDGAIFLEMGDGQARSVKKIFEETQGYRVVKLINDYCSVPRIAVIKPTFCTCLRQAGAKGGFAPDSVVKSRGDSTNRPFGRPAKRDGSEIVLYHRKDRNG